MPKAAPKRRPSAKPEAETKPECIIVAMPTRGAISAETHYCLRHHMDGFPIWEEIVARKPVVEARNELARRIRGLKLPMDARFVLWTDDDAWWPPGSVARAVEILSDDAEIAMLCGYFGARRAMSRPLVYGSGEYPKLQSPGPSEPVAILYCSFHWVMMRREVLEAVGDDPFNLSERHDLLPEDYSFCERVADASLKVFCATDVYVVHVEATDGAAYLPRLRQFRMRDFWPDLSRNVEHLDTEGAIRSYGAETDERWDRVRALPDEEKYRSYGKGVDDRSAALAEAAAEVRPLYDRAYRALTDANYDVAAILISRADKKASQSGLTVRGRDFATPLLGWLNVSPRDTMPEPPTANQVRAQIRAALENKKRKTA